MLFLVDVFLSEHDALGLPAQPRDLAAQRLHIAGDSAGPAPLNRQLRTLSCPSFSACGLIVDRETEYHHSRRLFVMTRSPLYVHHTVPVHTVCMSGEQYFRLLNLPPVDCSYTKICREVLHLHRSKRRTRDLPTSSHIENRMKVTDTLSTRELCTCTAESLTEQRMFCSRHWRHETLDKSYEVSHVHLTIPVHMYVGSAILPNDCQLQIIATLSDRFKFARRTK